MFRISASLACELARLLVVFVWLAFIRNCALGDEKVERIDQMAAAATKILVIAVDHILRRECDFDLTFRLNTKTISQGSRCGKGPAAATLVLV